MAQARSRRRRGFGGGFGREPPSGPRPNMGLVDGDSGSAGAVDSSGGSFTGVDIYSVVMAGPVPATYRRERTKADTGATPLTIVFVGHRDKPGGDGEITSREVRLVRTAR